MPALLAASLDVLHIIFFFCMHHWVTVLIRARMKASSFHSVVFKALERIMKAHIHCRRALTEIEINCLACSKQHPVWIKSSSCPYVFILANAEKILNSGERAGRKEILWENWWCKVLCVWSSSLFFMHLQNTNPIIRLHACKTKNKNQSFNLESGGDYDIILLLNYNMKNKEENSGLFPQYLTWSHLSLSNPITVSPQMSV